MCLPILPVFAHLEGVCHVYVDGKAKLPMAKAIVLNAKMRRTGVCGAAETLLVDRAAAPTHLMPLVHMLIEAGCEVRGDKAPRIKRLSEYIGESYFDYLAKLDDLVLLMDEAHLIAVRDRHGFWPLVLGRVEGGGWVVASETAALDILGAHVVREVEPGSRDNDS